MSADDNNTRLDVVFDAAVKIGGIVAVAVGVLFLIAAVVAMSLSAAGVIQ